MKNSLWVVVVIVVGIVGFLLGYSYSSYTGVRETTNIQTREGATQEESAVAQPGGGPAVGYGAPAAPAAPQAAAPGGQAEQAAGTKASPDQPSQASPSTAPRRKAKPAAAMGY